MGNLSTIHAVAPETASSKLILAISIIYKFLTPVIAPLALVGACIAFISLIIGAAVHSRTLKRVGFTDLGVIGLALLFYYFTPTLIGLIKTIQQTLQ